MPAGLIAHINLARGLRGGEFQTLMLLDELADHGWRQRLITRPGAELAAAARAANPSVEVRAAANPISAALACRGATLVHAHDGRGVYAAALAGSIGRRPYIITRRVMNPLGRGWATRAAYRRAAALVAISSAVSAALTDYDARLAPTLIPSAGRPAAPASGLAKSLRERWGERFVVGNVAALEQDSKGQLTLIEAARSAPWMHVVLVGSGRDEQRLKAAAANLANVEFTGQVSDVDAYLDAFDVFAFPSLREGFGSVLLDAMRAGLPVVAHAAGGIVDIVVEGSTGFLVRPGDASGFLKALEKLHADATTRHAFEAAARQRAQEFAPNVMGNRYHALYNRVLARDVQEAKT